MTRTEDPKLGRSSMDDGAISGEDAPEDGTTRSRMVVMVLRASITQHTHQDSREGEALSRTFSAAVLAQEMVEAQDPGIRRSLWWES